MNTVLSADQCRAARAALGLSQAAVARATAVNRSQLALFEVRRYVLEDERLRTLRRYFEAGGYAFDAVPRAQVGHQPAQAGEQSQSADDTKLIDGFLVASGLEQEPVEGALAEIAGNDEAIGRLAATPPRTGLWAAGTTKERDAALRLMARNYLLVRGLQGRSILPDEESSAAEAPPSVAAQLRQVLTAQLAI